MSAGSFFDRGNRWMGKHMFLVVLPALLAGFILHRHLPAGWPWNTIAVVLFAYMTFVTSLDISFRDFLHVLARPGVLLWTLLLIHAVMPIVAFSIARIFFPQQFYVQLGFLVGAAVPVGVTSIIWTSVLDGDTALALATVTLDTLLVPFWLPLFLVIIAGRSVPVDYGHMLKGLLWMVTLPSLAGMLLTDLTHGRYRKFAHSGGGFTAKAALALVVFINAARVAPEVEWDLSLTKMLFALLLLVVFGYGLGYLGSRVLKEPRWDTVVAMVYNVGMRNISFASVLAVSYLPRLAAVPVTLLMLYQQPVAAVAAHLLNHRAKKLRTPVSARIS